MSNIATVSISRKWASEVRRKQRSSIHLSYNQYEMKAILCMVHGRYKKKQEICLESIITSMTSCRSSIQSSNFQLATNVLRE